MLTLYKNVIGGCTMSVTLTDRLIQVYVPLPEDIIEALKAKSGECTIKDALAKAIYHYLNCPYTLQNLKNHQKSLSEVENPYTSSHSLLKQLSL